MFGIDLNQHSTQNAKSSHGSLTQGCHQQLKRISEMFKIYIYILQRHAANIEKENTYLF